MCSNLTRIACALTFLGLLGPGFGWAASENQPRARRASVRVLLPAGAQLTINGKVPENPKNRRFVTPPLEQGQTYTYTFQAKYSRGQKSITIRRKVTLRPGQKKVVSLRSSKIYGRSSRFANTRSRPVRGYSYRLNVDHPWDPAYGTYSYRDMRVYTRSGERP
jgi:uncharacterized protein (TIGR03000 family)